MALLAGTARSTPSPTISQQNRRFIVIVLLTSFVLTIAYWVLWYTVPAVVASDTRSAYFEFENAFPLADAWLAFCLLAGAVTLQRQRPLALFWLLAGGGAGLYLFGMDLLYDLEHGIWFKGIGGLIELAINILTLVVSVSLLRWSWKRRIILLNKR